VNELLNLPFAIKVATKDWHPQDHVSFASNHPAPNNVPFITEITISNPHNSSEVETTRLWPDHCVQGTNGAKLIPELDQTKIDHIIEKGQDKRVEMYSAFADPFLNPTVSRSKLEDILREAGITDIYCVGLAMDYCLKFTAIDAAKAGFTTFVINEGTKAVDPSAWSAVEKQLKKAGVQMVNLNGKQVDDVRKYQA
jgi:nicotinamidase-related amidase